MKIAEKFISASANPRSHCLAVCSTRPLIVYASSLQLVVQTIPTNKDHSGVIRSVSEKRHNKQITVLKRVKSHPEDEFVSGGVDSRVVLWRLNGENVVFTSNLEGASGSIGSVCGCTIDDRKVVVASWVSDSSSGVNSWWTDKNGSVRNNCSIAMEHKAFALCLDVMANKFDSTILAVGTSKRFVELFVESSDRSSFSRVVSVPGHTDWIHSIAFNDNADNLLIASAGQDKYVRLWKVEDDIEVEEGVLTSSQNRFVLTDSSGKEHSTRMSSHSVLTGHDDWVHSTNWNARGDVLLTASSDKTTILWRESEEMWRDEVRLGIVGGQSAGFFSAVLSPDDKTVIAASYFGGLHAWVAQDEDMCYWDGVAMTGGHVGEVRDVSWQIASDGHSYFLATVGQDQTTRIFADNKSSGTMCEIARPQVHGHDMQCIDIISPSLFVSGAEEKIFRAFRAPKSFAESLRDVAGIDNINAFEGCELAEFGACVPALGLSNKSMAEGETVDDGHWEEDAFRAAPATLHAAPTEDVLQQNTLWPEQQKLYGHGYEVYAVASNPSGTVLATSCKSSHAEHSRIILWDTKHWKQMAQIAGHQLTVTQVSWNKTGDLLLSVSRDRTVRIYKETNGDLHGFSYVQTWCSAKEHSRIVWACDWFDDSRHFATASRDQKVIIWRANEEGIAGVVRAVKINEPATAIAVSSGNIESAIVVAGTQSGALLFLSGPDFSVTETMFSSPIVVDAAVLRLRFAPSEGGSQRLAVAASDAKLRVLNVEC